MLLTRVFEFSAAHRLHSPKLSEKENEKLFGLCGRSSGHGHNYRLEVTVSGEPDPVIGYAINLSDLEDLVNSEVIQRLDHRFLNQDIPYFASHNPTAENILIWIWNVLEASLGKKYPQVRLHRLKLWETSFNAAEYTGPEE